MSTPIINNPPRLQNQVRLLLDHIDREGLEAGDPRIGAGISENPGH